MPSLHTYRSMKGMVCSVDHLASQAGIAVLRAGGSAADAAVAMSAVLAVTTQHMCGMGGDLLALVHHADGSDPDCLNSSGRAGRGADPERLRAAGHTRMPLDEEIQTVTVPGCVDGWLALHERHGRLPLAEVLEPARAYAAEGFPASPHLAATVPRILHVDGADDYRRGPIRPGTIITRPGVARTLAAIADGGRAAFYEGEFGEGLLRVGDGLFSAEDLRRSQADWVEALGLDVWGHRTWTVPPNSQGYLSLAAARIAELAGMSPGDAPEPGTAEWVHLLVEASRLAGHDRPAVLHDAADGCSLLADERLVPRAARIDPDRRGDLPPLAEGGGTIYLCAADGEGQAVSLIQSNARGWGAHIAVPEVGIFLHNRGLGFSLEPGHPAELAPGRRPPHTLSPALVQRTDGSLRAVLGTMGGDTQPQVVLQMLARLLLHDQSAGRIVPAPRWRLGSGGFDTWADGGPGTVAIEDDAPPAWAEGLAARGHVVERDPAWSTDHGHAHLIERGEDGVLAGMHDPRALTGGTATW
ncbi:gamma-glutamyltransferase family protein [Actinomarinicola tropica]|uniref:Gamma-glutamyltranspeptidase n=1 Tax=Actinomarinicola tropica TaxID=2789776 RepID=A0A5Q2RBM9_9ACTN|nr:gamma-glutamyltransferase [Actinomarinicola tropica]QGG94279.1 gamma-glutamyltranspeptidase [Actinomarinicola tropica]